MKFLVDANLPRSTISLLSSFDHTVDFVRDSELADAPDERIAERALQTDAAILSRDLDFADIRQYPPEEYKGIVVLRLPDDAVAYDIVEVLRSFLAVDELIDQLEGRLAIVEAERVRFRPPLD